jgi:radical SAM protein with 4Fe4S-binding SPASM domain
LSRDLAAALRVLKGRARTAVFTGGLPVSIDRSIETLRDGGVDRLVYSIDGATRADNDRLRGRIGVTDDLLAFAGAVRDRLPRVDRSVNTVVSRFNVDALDGIWETMSPFGLNSWSLTLAGDFFAASPRHAFLDVAALETFYFRTIPRLSARLAKDRAELVVLPVPFPFLEARLPPARWGEAPSDLRAAIDVELELYSRGEYNATFVRRCGCPLVGIDVVIGVGGEVHPCSQPPIIHPSYVVGNVKRQTLAEILDGDPLRAFGASVPNAPCTRCWAPSNVPREVLSRLVARASTTT